MGNNFLFLWISIYLSDSSCIIFGCLPLLQILVKHSKLNMLTLTYLLFAPELSPVISSLQGSSMFTDTVVLHKALSYELWHGVVQVSPFHICGSYHAHNFCSIPFGKKKRFSCTFSSKGNLRRWNLKMSFPGGSDGKEPTCNAGDLGSITGFNP